MIADTNALVAFLARPESIPGVTLELMQASSVQLKASAASLYEVAAAHRRGVIDFDATQFERELTSLGIEILAVTPAHMRLAGGFRIDSPDPWTRVVAAQAQAEDLPVISENPTYDVLGLQRIWG